jgi:hypothetical protein
VDHHPGSGKEKREKHGSEKLPLFPKLSHLVLTMEVVLSPDSCEYMVAHCWGPDGSTSNAFVYTVERPRCLNTVWTL